MTIKIKYQYSRTVYLILNKTVFSLSYNMKWSWKECYRILYWPWQILTEIGKKIVFHSKFRLGMFLSMFLFFQGFLPGCSYKRCFYRIKKVYDNCHQQPWRFTARIYLICILDCVFFGRKKLEIRQNQMNPNWRWWRQIVVMATPDEFSISIGPLWKT